MSTEFKVSEKAADQAPSKLELQAGETIAVKDAIKALVTKSANDVAVVIAENIGGSEAAFARAMTEKARALGMSRTLFRNASGLPNDEQTTSARDLITLAQRTLREFPEYSKVFQTRFFQYKGHIHRNHNGLLFSYPGAEGMKTGFTQAAGFNLVITARRGGKHLIAVVLGGQSSFSRNQAMRELLDAGWPSASSTGKPAEPVIASAAAAPVFASRAAPVISPALAQPGPEAPSEAESETPEVPEPNPAFHSTPEELRLQAQILAAINGSQSSGGKGGVLPITAVLAGATSERSEAGSPAEAPVMERVTAVSDVPAEPAALAAPAEQPAPAVASPAPESAVAQASQAPASSETIIPQSRAVHIEGAWSREAAPKGDLAAIAAPAAAASPVSEQAVEPAAASSAAAAPAAVAESAPAATEGEPPAPAETAAPVQVAAATPTASPVPAAPRAAPQYGPYHVQVGSYGDAAGAQTRLTAVMTAAAKVVKGHPPFTATAQISGRDVFRARYGSFSEKEAESACAVIKKQKFDCLVVRAD